MKYAIEMSSGAMIYVYTKSNKNWFRLSNVNRDGIHRHTDSMESA
jgi:hypothetical protein